MWTLGLTHGDIHQHQSQSCGYLESHVSTLFKHESDTHPFRPVKAFLNRRAIRAPMHSRFTTVHNGWSNGCGRRSNVTRSHPGVFHEKPFHLRNRKNMKMAQKPPVFMVLLICGARCQLQPAAAFNGDQNRSRANNRLSAGEMIRICPNCLVQIYRCAFLQVAF